MEITFELNGERQTIGVRAAAIGNATAAATSRRRELPRTPKRLSVAAGRLWRALDCGRPAAA
jgi:hypothetical protein